MVQLHWAGMTVLINDEDQVLLWCHCFVQNHWVREL
jgi:hypothetical protein